MKPGAYPVDGGEPIRDSLVFGAEVMRWAVVIPVNWLRGWRLVILPFALYWWCCRGIWDHFKLRREAK